MTARELVNIPANLLYPESFAEQVRNLVRGSKIIIDVLDETALSQGRVRRVAGRGRWILPAATAGPAQL